jgi:hypothetical protein
MQFPEDCDEVILYLGKYGTHARARAHIFWLHFETIYLNRIFVLSYHQMLSVINMVRFTHHVHYDLTVILLYFITPLNNTAYRIITA